MLHLSPSGVRTERAEAGNTTPITTLLPDLVRDGVAAVSANGVVGDPTGANPADGAHRLEAMAAEAAGSVLAGQADETGRLLPRVGSMR